MFYAQPLKQESLLSKALGRIDDTDLLSTLEGDLINLTNSSIVAYGESPKNLTHTQSIARRVVATLNLGMESLMSADEPLAFPHGEEAAALGAALLRQWPLQDIFRHGYAAVQPLHQDAHRLISDPVIKIWVDQEHTADDYSQDRLDREFINALGAIRPLHSGYEALKPTETKAFESKEELREAVHRLNRIRERVG